MKPLITLLRALCTSGSFKRLKLVSHLVVAESLSRIVIRTLVFRPPGKSPTIFAKRKTPSDNVPPVSESKKKVQLKSLVRARD